MIQLWDLRNAYSPVKEFQGHSKGVLDIDWCVKDANMLLSCGKDNRTLVWDPLAAEEGSAIIAELPVAQNWVFEVSWCPRNPGLITTSSFDGSLSLFSLQPGQQVGRGARGGNVCFWFTPLSSAQQPAAGQ
jgi:protein transport protein SEC31